MINYAARLAGAATLALAALPMAALSTTAYAAPVTVRVADLDLNSLHGQAAYEQRVERAAKRFCKAEKRVASRLRVADGTCVAAVRHEMADKLVVAVQAQRGQQGVYAVR
jgi:UrcA family protein